jgi:16S rRNA (cytosine1402-N4)-methyltransferase
LREKGIHKSVLLNESIDYLVTNISGIYFEGTMGFGGHSEEILLRLNEDALLVGTDKDTEAFRYCQKKFQTENRLSIYNTSFVNLDTIARLENITNYDGIFVDLGVSSYQLDNLDSGFTYREKSVFDLRMDKSQGNPAYYYVNTLDQKELADIIYKFGEEKKSRVIARNLVEARKENEITGSDQIKSIVQRSVPGKFLNKSLSRVFQAFRIFVNNELDELKLFLDKSVELLGKSGRIVVITFHSLEDRIVKEFFRYEALTCICPPEVPVCICDKEARLKILTKKPLVPSEEERENNPRSRSAKLRVAERL